MSLDPEDFKPKPERCQECKRWNVHRAYAWQMRVCDECQSYDPTAPPDGYAEPEKPKW